MSLLWSWLFPPPPRKQPERVPTDTVVSLSILEKSWMMRSVHMNWSLRFDQVLDTTKLQQSLEELISNGPSWRKLGGRFRLNVIIHNRELTQ